MKIKKQELSQLFYITNLLTIVLKVIYMRQGDFVTIKSISHVV